MYAVEFTSTIQDDGTIKVPNEYKDKVGKNVKVILLSEAEKTSSFPEFSAISINTSGYKFDRNEANENAVKALNDSGKKIAEKYGIVVKRGCVGKHSQEVQV